MKKGKIFIISGPSGVGKGTVIDTLKLKYDNINVAISATTRKPRKDEENKKTYYFLKKDSKSNQLSHSLKGRYG